MNSQIVRWKICFYMHQIQKFSFHRFYPSKPENPIMLWFKVINELKQIEHLHIQVWFINLKLTPNWSVFIFNICSLISRMNSSLFPSSKLVKFINFDDTDFSLDGYCSSWRDDRYLQEEGQGQAQRAPVWCRPRTLRCQS